MSLLSILFANTTYFALAEFFYNFFTKPLRTSWVFGDEHSNFDWFSLLSNGQSRIQIRPLWYIQGILEYNLPDESLETRGTSSCELQEVMEHGAHLIYGDTTDYSCSIS